MTDVETHVLYRALKSVNVDDDLARESVEEALGRIPNDVRASAFYRALRSRNVDLDLSREAVEGLRDVVKPRP